MSLAIGIFPIPHGTIERLVAVFSLWPLLIPLIVLYVAFRAWDRTGRDPRERSHAVRYEPIEGVSPAELGRLVADEQPHMRVITATFVDLAARGFLLIEQVPAPTLFALTRDVEDIARSAMLGLSGSTDYVIQIVRQRPEWKDLKRHEERSLEALISAAPMDSMTKRNRVRVSLLKNKLHLSVPMIFEAIDSELISRGYYRKHPDEVRKQWQRFATSAFLGGVVVEFGMDWLGVPHSSAAFFGVVVLSSLILFAFSQVMPARTVAGARARDATLGFKEFLGRVENERFRKSRDSAETFEREENSIPSAETFEHYLPYAIAFGVEHTWAVAFEAIYRAPPDALPPKP